MSRTNDDEPVRHVWARPQMNVTFRAEIMPGTLREDRTFKIEKVLTNGRVTLENFKGEYRESAFEAINFLRDKDLKGIHLADG